MVTVFWYVQCTFGTWHCGEPWPPPRRSSGTRLVALEGPELLCAGVGPPQEHPYLPVTNTHSAPTCNTLV